MKAKRTIQNQIRMLRGVIDDPRSSEALQRVAYAMETTLLYVVRRPGEQPNNLVHEARMNAALLDGSGRSR